MAKDLSNFDNLGIKIDNRQIDDMEALESYQCNMTKDLLTNSYIVGFPWIGNIPPGVEELESNYHMVKKRFDSTMKKLDKEKEKLKEYASVHQKEIEDDFIERVPLKDLRSHVHFKHFINHFPVWKDDSTTKCRRVFDASLHAKGKASLNDLMLKGSQLTPHILTTLLRLRLFPFLLCMDFSKGIFKNGLAAQRQEFYMLSSS